MHHRLLVCSVVITGGLPPIASEPTPSPRLWTTSPGANPAKLCEHYHRAQKLAPKPELSTWPGIGTFYLAPTKAGSQMKAEQRFHTYVTAATITVMYFVIQHGAPVVSGLDPTFARYLAPLAALLLSVGIYKTLASSLLKITRRWKFIKRWMLGASYINGTWVGKFSAEHGAVVLRKQLTNRDLVPWVRPETYFETGSSGDNLPSSASMSIAAAVNCLLIEPMLYLMEGLAGTRGSRRASP